MSHVADGAPEEPVTHRFKPGDAVVRVGELGEVGTVVRPPRSMRGVPWYRVRFGADESSYREADLAPYGGARTVEDYLREGQYGGQEAFSRRLTFAKLVKPVRETIYSYGASRTKVRAYQFKPLLKYLASPRRRILVADEVGLGKTIEAGYIMQEERARGRMERILVVCPAALRLKWANEMWMRFRERFDLLDRTAIRSRLPLRDDGGFVDRRLQAIASLQSLRSEDVIEHLAESPAQLDLLIVDEAHHCRNSDTWQHRVVRELAESSDGVVFLTATPVHTGSANLFNLLRLLVPEDFDNENVFHGLLEANKHVVRAEALLARGTQESLTEAHHALARVKQSSLGRDLARNPIYEATLEALQDERSIEPARLVEVQQDINSINILSRAITRTRKREVEEEPPVRRAHTILVTPTDEELELYESLSHRCFEMYVASHGAMVARLAIVNVQRQIASSLPAALAHFRDRESNKDPASVFDVSDNAPGADSWRATINDPLIREAIDAADMKRLEQLDSKYASLRTVLANQDKAIVFAYYKKSLRYLERRLLADGVRCVRIDGDVPHTPDDPERDERQRRIAHFRDDTDVQVLLSSEVGSEGLDFQFCNTVVNWDLPWNPMVVEQRIGRIDRFGQESDVVHIFNLAMSQTIEATILARLYDRIGIFEGSVGDLEPILGPQVRTLTERLFDPTLSAADRERIVRESAIAIERERDQIRQLERESPQLIGHDHLFNKQLEEIGQLGRFVAGPEIRTFVADFLKRHYPTCALTAPRSGPGGRWRLKLDPSLIEFVRRRLPRDDPSTQRFMDGVGRAVTVVFDGEAALTDLSAELIHARHPLVQAIVAYLRDESEEIHPLSALAVNSEAVEQGVYFYAWASLDERGLFAGRSLWAEVIDVQSDPPRRLDDRRAVELLMRDMIVDGEDWSAFDDPDPMVGTELFEIASVLFVDHVADYKRQQEQRVRRHVEARRATLESTYQTKRRSREAQLAKHREKGNRRVVPLFEAQIRKLDAEHEHRVQELDDQRNVSVSFNIEGAGFVFVQR